MASLAFALVVVPPVVPQEWAAPLSRLSAINANVNVHVDERWKLPYRYF